MNLIVSVTCKQEYSHVNIITEVILIQNKKEVSDQCEINAESVKINQLKML